MTADDTGQPVLHAIEEALLQGAAGHKHRARNIVECITKAGYEVKPKPDSRPRVAHLELVERVPTVSYAPDHPDAAVFPTEVWINGQSLHTSLDHPTKVHEISVGDGFVLATVTLICRSVVVEQRPQEDS